MRCRFYDHSLVARKFDNGLRLIGKKFGKGTRHFASAGEIMRNYYSARDHAWIEKLKHRPGSQVQINVRMHKRKLLTGNLACCGRKYPLMKGDASRCTKIFPNALQGTRKLSFFKMPLLVPNIPLSGRWQPLKGVEEVKLAKTIGFENQACRGSAINPNLSHRTAKFRCRSYKGHNLIGFNWGKQHLSASLRRNNVPQSTSTTRLAVRGNPQIKRGCRIKKCLAGEQPYAVNRSVHAIAMSFSANSCAWVLVRYTDARESAVEVSKRTLFSVRVTRTQYSLPSSERMKIVGSGIARKV